MAGVIAGILSKVSQDYLSIKYLVVGGIIATVQRSMRLNLH